MTSAKKFERYKAEVNEMIELSGRLTLRNKLKSEKHLEIYRGLSEGIRIKSICTAQWTLRKR